MIIRSRLQRSVPEWLSCIAKSPSGHFSLQGTSSHPSSGLYYCDARLTVFSISIWLFSSLLMVPQSALAITRAFYAHHARTLTSNASLARKAIRPSCLLSPRHQLSLNLVQKHPIAPSEIGQWTILSFFCFRPWSVRSCSPNDVCSGRVIVSGVFFPFRCGIRFIIFPPFAWISFQGIVGYVWGVQGWRIPRFYSWLRLLLRRQSSYHYYM